MYRMTASGALTGRQLWWCTVEELAVAALALAMLLVLPAPARSDDRLDTADGLTRIYARDRGGDRQALVDDHGRLLGYRVRDDDGGWRYLSTAGDRRLETRSRGDDIEALVDDRGELRAYRRARDDGWRYSAGDGTPLGDASSDD